MVLITGLLFVSCDSDDSSNYDTTQEGDETSRPLDQSQNSRNILASVNVTSDIIVEFIEVGEGNVVISTLQSMDSDKEISDNISNIIDSGKSNFEIYTKLANNNINPIYIENLKQADSKFEIFKKKVENGEIIIQPFTDDFSLTSNKNNAQKNATAPCEDRNGNDYSRSWFLDNFVYEKTYYHKENLQSFSTPISLGDIETNGIDHMKWYVFNGNFNDGLVVDVNFNSGINDSFTVILPARWWWRVKNFYAPFGGTINLNLENGATCPSTHVSMELVNIDREEEEE